MWENLSQKTMSLSGASSIFLICCSGPTHQSEFCSMFIYYKQHVNEHCRSILRGWLSRVKSKLGVKEKYIAKVEMVSLQGKWDVPAWHDGLTIQRQYICSMSMKTSIRHENSKYDQLLRDCNKDNYIHFKLSDSINLWNIQNNLAWCYFI